MAPPTLVAVTLVTFVIALAADESEPVSLVLHSTALVVIASAARRWIRRTAD